MTAQPSARPEPSFGRLLAKYRIDDDLSQNVLGKLVGMNSSYISRLERDDRAHPSREIVLGIARELDLNRTRTDRLLYAAGLTGTRVTELGIDDPTLKALLVALTSSSPLPVEMVDDFREIVERGALILTSAARAIKAADEKAAERVAAAVLSAWQAPAAATGRQRA